jgi:hypothetical protein
VLISRRDLKVLGVGVDVDGWDRTQCLESPHQAHREDGQPDVRILGGDGQLVLGQTLRDLE